jgi:hypothetical protein
MTTIKGYVDDSGDDHDPQHTALSMAGYLGVAERGGRVFSDRGESGFLPGQYSNRRTEIHEETETKSFGGVQSASGPGGDPG